MSDKNNSERKLELNGILKFDNATGPSAGSQADILSDLCKISNAAFGTDFNAEEQGTEWYSFLQSLSAALADFGGAAMQIYNNISVNNATGVTLDTICSLNGIQRKSAVPAYVTLTRTRENATSVSTISKGTVFVDDNGLKWESFEDVTEVLEGNDAKVSIELESIADNPTTAYIAKDGFIRLNTSTVQYTNEPSKAGQPQESDAQLRYRYAASQGKEATGTTYGLRSKILALPDVSYCAIEMNTSATELATGDYAGLKPHSICVMVDGPGHTPSTTKSSTSTDKTDIAIAETILLHKSLGCGTSGLTNAAFDVSGRGTISCKFDAEDYNGPEGTQYIISFVRVKPISWTLHYELKDEQNTDKTSDATVSAAIKTAVNSYVYALSPGTAISYYAIYSILAKVLYDADKTWAIDNFYIAQGEVTSEPAQKTTVINITDYQYADVPYINPTASST